jgi:hypothetical protein
MAVPTLDFDWLLEHATAIVFDPARPSIYVFGLGLSLEALEMHVLSPMQAAGLFNVADTKVLDDKTRGQYRGQLPRVALTVFDVSGHPCGIVLTYHDKFKPDLSQYEAWLQFWHTRQLAQAQDRS